MSHEYYIINGQNYAGPYDLVALVIKIRNGSLPATGQVQRGDSQEVKAAKEWEELREFFSIIPAKKDIAQKASKKLYLGESLKNGLNFIQANQIAVVMAGVIILLVAGVTGLASACLPDDTHVFSYIIGFVTLQFLLCCYSFMLLRMTRGQQFSLAQVLQKVQPVAFKLIRASLLISFPVIVGIILFTYFEDNLIVCLIGLLIIIIPGIYIISIYSFAPLLIIERGNDVWEAMETSRNAVMKSGTDNFGVYFSLNMINLIAALCMIFPMAVTLPVTMSAITEAYEEMFS